MFSSFSFRSCHVIVQLVCYLLCTHSADGFTADRVYLILRQAVPGLESSRSLHLSLAIILILTGTYGHGIISVVIEMAMLVVH